MRFIYCMVTTMDGSARRNVGCDSDKRNGLLLARRAGKQFIARGQRKEGANEDLKIKLPELDSFA